MPISGLATEELLEHFFVFLRIAAMMAVLPAFGERSIPARVRLGLALCLTAAVTPLASSLLPVLPGSFSGWLAVGGFETLAGLLLGVSLRLFVIALQVAGAIAAQSTSLSQIFGNAGIDPMPAIGHLLVISGLALAVTLGFHVKLISFVVVSYEILPGGRPLPALDVAEWGTRQVGKAFALGFSLAAPFVIASTIYNIALGAINRAMPQLMVSFVGAPAITAGGLALLLLCAPFALSAWQSAMDVFMANPFGGPQ